MLWIIFKEFLVREKSGMSETRINILGKKRCEHISKALKILQNKIKTKNLLHSETIVFCFSCWNEMEANNLFISIISAIKHYLFSLYRWAAGQLCSRRQRKTSGSCAPLIFPCTVNKSIPNLRNRKPDGLPATSPGQAALRASSATVAPLHAPLLWRHTHSTSGSMND